MNRLIPVILILLLTSVLWGTAQIAGRYLEQGLVRKELLESPGGKQIADLRKQLEGSPEDVERRIALGDAYVDEGYRLQNGQLVLRGLEQYKAVLDLDGNNPRALLGLARVSLQNGVLDRASEFFERYLRIHPEDLNARNDRAVALAQLQRGEQAVEELNEIDRRDPGFFPAKLTRALVSRVTGDQAGAEAALRDAAQSAPTEQMKQELLGAISQLQGIAPGVIKESPASAVTSYFKGHAILGPKITKFDWDSENELSVYVREFPVSQMPAPMRELFVSRAKEKLSGITALINITLRDDSSRETLLKLSVGKDTVENKASNSTLVHQIGDGKTNNQGEVRKQP